MRTKTGKYVCDFCGKTTENVFCICDKCTNPQRARDESANRYYNRDKTCEDEEVAYIAGWDARSTHLLSAKDKEIAELRAALEQIPKVIRAEEDRRYCEHQNTISDPPYRMELVNHYYSDFLKEKVRKYLTRAPAGSEGTAG